MPSPVVIAKNQLSNLSLPGYGSQLHKTLNNTWGWNAQAELKKNEITQRQIENLSSVPLYFHKDYQKWPFLIFHSWVCFSFIKNSLSSCSATRLENIMFRGLVKPVERHQPLWAITHSSSHTLLSRVEFYKDINHVGRVF